jgi:cellulose synthase/poly-beta-1,6-N-acetylglucosamine synthase-like glycosyltransferase
MSVVVPTYRRPVELARCLDALVIQRRASDEIIVVRRADDDDACDVVRQRAAWIREVIVSSPGQVAAMKAGSQASTGVVIAFIDDDAVAPSGWLDRMTGHFLAGDVVAVGGRDRVHTERGAIPASTRKVGYLTWWGRAVGNHHIGTGGPRNVDILKGCNFAVRKDVLGIPQGLKGLGAQVANDMAASLWAGRRGGRVIYDPALIVDHFPAPRPAGESRSTTDREAQANAVYNTTLTICTLRPHLRWRYAIYHLTIGTRSIPGVVRFFVALVRREARPVQFRTAQRALLAGFRDARRGALTFWSPATNTGS